MQIPTFTGPVLKHILLAGVITGSASLARADEPQPVGDQTNQWLDLQASGTVASPEERPLPGEIADRSFERYAESFSQPIPEVFARDGFVSDSGGD